MPSKGRYGRIKKKIEKLRDHSLTVASKANRILAEGVQRLADRELRTLNETYRTTLSALKRGASTKDDLVGRAHQQLDVMQRAADQLIASARHALEVAGNARAELTALVGQALQGKKVTRRDVERAVKPARDLLKRAPKAKTPAKKEKAARAAARPKARAATAAAKKPRKAAARPSPNSRARRATSNAKNETAPVVAVVKEPTMHAGPSASSTAASE